MTNIGIISNDDIDKVGHSLFLNFRKALKNTLNCELRNVTDMIDLVGLKYLIIVDEHYDPNVKVWKNDLFINELNIRKIQTIVFNFERIYNSSFPWNVDHQKFLERIQNLTQFVSDIDDAKLMGKTVINKQFLSKDTDLSVNNIAKQNKIVFIGQLNGYYPTRKKVIDEASKFLNLEVIVTDRKLSYRDFLIKLNNYRYVFNPLGTGKFINLRFYEALKLSCIPIQEIREDMRSWYPELENCIDFTSVSDITEEKFVNFHHNPKNYYLEDYFNDIKLLNYFNG